MQLKIYATCWPFQSGLNTLRPRQNGRHFADDIFKYIFTPLPFYSPWSSFTNSFKFVPKVQINNIAALVQIMAWRRPGDKPLSEPIMVSLQTHICVTWPQWVNLLKNTAHKELMSAGPISLLLTTKQTAGGLTVHWIKPKQLLTGFRWYCKLSSWAYMFAPLITNNGLVAF